MLVRLKTLSSMAQTRWFQKEYFLLGHIRSPEEKIPGSKLLPQIYNQDAQCIVTPTDKTDTTALEKINALWHAVGMNVISLTTDEHDFIFGAVSHLPHIVAYALMNTLGALKTPENRDVTAFSGAGLKDITRIASSDPVMWRDICLSNRNHSLDLIDRFQNKLEIIRNTIEKGDGQELKKEFIAANKYRLNVV